MPRSRRWAYALLQPTPFIYRIFPWMHRVDAQAVFPLSARRQKEKCHVLRYLQSYQAAGQSSFQIGRNFAVLGSRAIRSESEILKFS